MDCLCLDFGARDNLYSLPHIVSNRTALELCDMVDGEVSP